MTLTTTAPGPAPVTARELLTTMTPEPSGIGATIQSVLENWAPATGAFVGGLAGGVLGGGAGGLGAAPGAVAGAGLGGAAGRVLPELTRPLLTGQPAEPPAQTAAAATVTGLTEATGQAAGGVLGRAASRALAPMAERVIPFARDVVAPALRRVGQKVTPGLMTESRIVDTLENIADASLLGGGRIEAVRRGAAEEGVRQLTDELIDEVGTRLSAPEVAQLLTRSRETAQHFARAIKRVLYRQVDELAKNVFVDTRPIWRALREGLGFRASQHVERALSAAGIDPERFFQLPVAGGGTVLETSFQLAQGARSRLLAVARRPATTAEDQAVRNTAAWLAGLLDEQMERAAKRLSPEALKAWREANAFTARLSETLDHRLVRRLFRTLGEEPARLDALLAAPNRADALRRIEQAVGRTAFQTLQQRLTTRLVERAVDPSTGVVQGRRLLTLIQGLGEDTARMVFGPALPRVRQFAQIADFVQRRAPGGTGTVMIQLAQAPATFQILRRPIGALESAAYTIVAGPIALGRLLTSERGVRWLTTGLRTPRALENAGPALRVLAGVAAAEPARRTAEEAVTP
ncbi:MAG TPA: hypothetical protein VNJ71_08810 [Gemmatimonadales bacterium]|nr:hypothetical protein [Gemmatimonadales bacterium]